MKPSLLASIIAATVLGAGSLVAAAPQRPAPGGAAAEVSVDGAIRSASISAADSGPSATPVTRSAPASRSGVVAPPAGSTDAGRWRWPLVPRPPVLRRFRAPPNPYAAGHRGIDLAAAHGSAVLAVERGIVTHRGWVAGRQTVTVRHRDGLESTYEPVAPTVAVGASVAAGQQLGGVAAPVGVTGGHCGARACLHLGARRGDGYVDPWPLLTGGRVVLLPLR
jgi:murein DD-endopeptidase MepM/ murein hydrolase activator NlpD